MTTEAIKYVYKCTKDYTGGLMDITRSIFLDVAETGIRTLDISPASMEVRTEVEFELEGYEFSRQEIIQIESPDIIEPPIQELETEQPIAGE
ncbi:hypothetical protein [Ewingella americana]|uniref:Uncharacterized protein n=1 Tax=Ewingella americana TaxID=41202 RepID=A0A502GF72_9GAMM|nr:hypothetical protein [Ewingella americana]TPG59940.1 hypothetical protein EAH77_15345 [Ewingella americana]